MEDSVVQCDKAPTTVNETPEHALDGRKRDEPSIDTSPNTRIAVQLDFQVDTPHTVTRAAAGELAQKEQIRYERLL